MPGWIRWLTAGITLGIALWCLTSGPLQAAPLCRTARGQQVGILKITRSAKNYWEYRAEVSIDGIRRPLGVYSCRSGEYISPQGSRTANDVGAQVICQFFNR